MIPKTPSQHEEMDRIRSLIEANSGSSPTTSASETAQEPFALGEAEQRQALKWGLERLHATLKDLETFLELAGINLGASIQEAQSLERWLTSPATPSSPGGQPTSNTLINGGTASPVPRRVSRKSKADATHRSGFWSE